MYEATSSSSVSSIEALIVKNNKSAMQNLDNNQPNHVLFYLNQALIACKSLGLAQGRDRLLALTYNNLGCYFQCIKSSEKALDFLFKAINLMSVEKDLTNLAGCHLNICSILSLQGEHERALRHAIKCVYILKSHEDSSAWMPKALFAAGTQYRILKQTTEAIDCFRKGLNLSRHRLGPKHELTCKLNKALAEINQTETAKPRENIRRVLRKFTPIIHRKYRSPDFSRPQRNVSMEKTGEIPRTLKNVYRLDSSFTDKVLRKKGKIDAGMHRAQERLAATTIQAWWRGCLQRKKYKQAKIMRQIRVAEFKAKIATDQANKLKKMVNENYKAQPAVKSPLINKEITKEVQALIKIQNTVKMFIEKKRYLKTVKACGVIQRFVKGLRYKRLFQKISSAVSFIQYNYRKYKKSKILKQ